MVKWNKEFQRVEAIRSDGSKFFANCFKLEFEDENLTDLFSHIWLECAGSGFEDYYLIVNNKIVTQFSGPPDKVKEESLIYLLHYANQESWYWQKLSVQLQLSRILESKMSKEGPRIQLEKDVGFILSPKKPDGEVISLSASPVVVPDVPSLRTTPQPYLPHIWSFVEKQNLKK